MRRMHVFGMGIAAGPDFVEQKPPGRFESAMQVEANTAIFLSGGADQSAQLRLQLELLAFASAHNDHPSDRLSRQLAPGRRPLASFQSGWLAGLGFALRHGGGDCSAKCCQCKSHEGIEPCVAKDQAGIPYFARNDTPDRKSTRLNSSHVSISYA